MTNLNKNIDGKRKSKISNQQTETPISPVVKAAAYKSLNHKKQIHLTKKGEIVLVTLPSQSTADKNQWQRIIDNFKFRLQKIDRSWQSGTKAQIQSQDRLLDTRQLNELENILEQVDLTIDLIITRRRQTAVAAASAGYSVQQDSSFFAQNNSLGTETAQELVEPLYLRNTIRSGIEIYHPSTVIIMGDVNPGASIVAHGDVLVWGSLKGIAHAGAIGSREAVIMALKMQPTQLRIADLVARAPDHPQEYLAEIAYISSEGIKIHVAANFYRYYSFVSANNCWIAKNKGKLKF